MNKEFWVALKKFQQTVLVLWRVEMSDERSAFEELSSSGHAVPSGGNAAEVWCFESLSVAKVADTDKSFGSGEAVFSFCTGLW